MIGQADLLQRLSRTVAKTVMITGPEHWGKKTLLRHLFKKEEAVYEIAGNAASFRETLERIYQTMRPTIYLIPDIDKANQTIQNLLLKVLEEPPTSARFFLTSSGPVLQTIVSRCLCFRMQPYLHTNAELAGIECPPQLMGMFSSPGELIALKFPGVEDVIMALLELKEDFDNRTLAFILKKCKDLNWKLKESGVGLYQFRILVYHIFGDSQSLEWLRGQPEDGVAYVRTQFFINLWMERQVLAQ